MSAPVPYSRLAEMRGEPARAARARSNERSIAAAVLPGPWPDPSPEASSVPAALRRRQAAARRLPPLASGKHDPIARTRRRTLLMVEHNDNTAWFRGIDRRQFRGLLRRAGIDRSMWDPVREAWCICAKDLDQVLAVADQDLSTRTSVRRVTR